MEKINFLVQGSAEEPYKVTFTKKDEKDFLAFCTCPAGENGMYCKHRINIINGDTRNIVSDNIQQVDIIARQWLPNSSIEAALEDVRKAESLLDDIKRAISLAKRNAAKAMRGG
ncbi:MULTISPECIES: SWIM zinc finger family protein [unclassified Photorhabdus]|uniref:SWIM zinc finger family protein n=1 Tax=unclassified Photorhabdus TaxID=2620880 RepID=UPI0013144001|nr:MULTISPECIES: SWIM zinc finger family protein [unclassified Photorhabdus]